LYALDPGSRRYLAQRDLPRPGAGRGSAPRGRHPAAARSPAPGAPDTRPSRLRGAAAGPEWRGPAMTAAPAPRIIDADGHVLDTNVRAIRWEEWLEEPYKQRAPKHIPFETGGGRMFLEG